MGCMRTMCEDFLRLLSLGYLVAGGVLIWGAWYACDLRSPKELLHVSIYWYPDVVGVFGALLVFLGVVASVGAWATWSGPISWFAGSSFVLLVVECAGCLAFTNNRKAFDDASLKDKTGALADTLAWIDDNWQIFFVLLYIAYATQGLGMIAGSSYAMCCRRQHNDYHRYSRSNAYWHGREEYAPLLPGSSSPAPSIRRAGDRRGKASPMQDSANSRHNSSNV